MMGLFRKLIKLGLVATGGFALYQVYWGLQQLFSRDVHLTLARHVNQAKSGTLLHDVTDHEGYTREHSIEDGIERVIYHPRRRVYDTPIVMQHGMWHGAWTWDTWGPFFAARGWEVHTHSLPGHSGSPSQTPIESCTLDYYLAFLKAEIDRQAHKPILLGHSMGGALAQWYLKYVGDLPAAVLVAPWPHELLLSGETTYFFSADLAAILLSLITRRAENCRSPQAAAHALLSETSVVSPQELFKQLGPESLLVMLQHHPPFWLAPKVINTPMLLLAGEGDVVVSLDALKQTAEHYHADFRQYPGAAHNLMMEKNHAEIAQHIHDWLVKVGVN
ncbi:MAG: alpha/beta fold hydrolase [Anaerolineaceae bacterium]|nr:alpha/beta fold hydrolase [Anaerolineaceae bacterium]